MRRKFATSLQKPYFCLKLNAGLKAFLFWIFLLGGGLSVINAQACSFTARVVDDKGNPVPYALVGLHELHRNLVADEKGVIILSSLLPGSYHAHISAVGYEAEAIHFDFRCGADPLVFTLRISLHPIQEFTFEEGLLKIREDEYSLKVELVDAEYLRQNQGHTFLNQIDRLPGVNVMNTGTSIGKPVLRGFSFNRVAVIDKGIRQEGQQWGWDHGLELDQFDMERVEVIKGPSAIVYGTDAIGGVIGIRLPEIPDEGSVEGQVHGIYRSVNDLYGMSAGVKLRLANFFFKARFSLQDYGDFRMPADSFYYNGFQLPIYEGRLKNTAGNERNFSVTGGWLFQGGYSMLSFSQVNQNVGFFSGAHGVPTFNSLEHDGDFRNLELPRQGIRHNKLIWNNNIKFGRDWLEIDLGYQFNDRQELSAPHSHGNLFPEDPESTEEHRFRLSTWSWNMRYHLSEKRKIRWIFGSSGQYQENQSSGFSFLIPGFNATQGGVWVMGRRRFSPRWNASWGARADVAHQRVFAFRQVRYSAAGQPVDTLQMASDLNRFYWNASASAGINFAPKDGHQFRLHMASSFRLPTVQELTANGLHHGTFRHEQGDTSLRPERGIHLDLIYELKKANWKINVAGFAYYFDRFIYLNPTGTFSPLPAAGQLFTYAQANAFQGGGEVSFDWHTSRAWDFTSYVEAVFTHNFTDGFPLPFIPPVAGGSEVSWKPWETLGKRIKSPYVSLSVNYAAPQHNIARNEWTTPAYLIAHAGMGASLQMGRQRLDVSLSVQNLFNTRYYQHINRYRILNLPEPGRNLNVSVVLHLEAGKQSIPVKS